MKRDFLCLTDLSQSEHEALFARAHELKARRRARLLDTSLAGRTLLLLFEKASTRTRVSFEAAMTQLGGNVVTLPVADSQLKRGETLADTARVVSRYVDAIMFRTHGDERLQELAQAATVPVINGLSEGGHPVQVLTDLFTIEERLGSVRGKRIAFLGDCASNMARSFVEATRVFGFQLRLCAPKGYLPSNEFLEGQGNGVEVTGNPLEAVEGVDALVTDVWTSMGQEAQAQQRVRDLSPYQLNEALLAQAGPDALVLHCLPAHRGEEITDGVLDGPQSVVLDEAENRMHVQKALLEQLILEQRVALELARTA